MSLKFRVGDVVERMQDRTEHRVAWCSDGEVGLAMAGVWGPEELTLLRRPVQVGDVLRLRKGNPPPYDDEFQTWRGRVERVDVGVYFGDVETACPFERYEHADGTAIAPPQPETAPVAATQGAGAMATLENVRQTKRPRHRTMAELREAVRAMEPPPLAIYRTAPEAKGVVYRQEWTVEQLARALWETEPRVVAFVAERGELHPPRTIDPARHERRIRDLAYARGIFGYAPETEWTADAWTRAEQILDVLRRRS